MAGIADPEAQIEGHLRDGFEVSVPADGVERRELVQAGEGPGPVIAPRLEGEGRGGADSIHGARTVIDSHRFHPFLLGDRVVVAASEWLVPPPGPLPCSGMARTTHEDDMSPRAGARSGSHPVDVGNPDAAPRP